ncbi:MAG: PEP-CTERM system TPR-repeat protein PrsT [Emcibacter sp.]|nr:PEP-CTERM system TPR-repeat protein PrsT [Emcibacter sp.]
MKKIAIFSIAILMGTSIPAFAAVNSEKSAEYIRDAQEYLQKGEVKSAIIQLKNAIVAEPKNPQYRVALADLYLQVKNAISAEKEYLRAIDLGMDSSKVIINLSKTRLLQREYETVLETLHEEDVADDKKGELYLIIGNAHQGLNDLDKALEFYEKGEKKNSGSDNIAIAIAQIYYFQKNMKQAEIKTDKVLSLNPKNIKGLILKGELVNLEQGPEKSIIFFEQALEYEPKNVSALFKMAAILFDLKRADEALERLDVIFSIMPNHPLANYLSAVIYTQRQELDKAEQFLDASGQALDNFPGALILRGVINYSQSNYAQAIYFLNKLVKITPDNVVARRLLGASLLRQNDAEEAIKVLLPIAKDGKAGPVVYTLLGSANMKLGKFDKGTEYFEKAVEINPEASKLRTQLALSKFAAGDAKAAQQNLQEILAKDPNSTQAAVFLTLISLREQKFDEAIVNADALIKQAANNPVGYNLKGAAFMAQGKAAEAREQYTKALNISSSYHSASMNLAQLELREGNEELGLEIYHGILKSNKKHEGALLALARNYKKKNLPTAEGYFQRIIEVAPNNIRARIEYSEFFILQKKMDRAKAVIQQVVADFPNQPAAFEANGNIDLIMGDIDSAITNFERMAGLLGNKAEAYQMLGRTQLRAKDPIAAKSNFVKALSMTDNKSSLLIDLISLEIIGKNFKKSQTYINQLKEIDDSKPVAYILEGRLLDIQGKAEDSLISYLKALKRGAGSSRFTVDLARAYINNEQTDNALEIIYSWLDEHKGDIAVRHILAGYYLQVNDYSKSIEQYEIILERSTENPIALNNIAWLYSKVGEDKKARTAAEKAYALFSDEASFIDTYAWILVQQGENDKGLTLLRKAVSKDPKMAEVRYHLAVALKNSGKLKAARKELETTISSGDTFPDMEKARKLLIQLSQ